MFGSCVLRCFEEFVCLDLVSSVVLKILCVLDLALSSVVLKILCVWILCPRCFEDFVFLDLVSSVVLKILCVWILCPPLF